mmetsp:Transcript_1417/g.2481  ORF Transcript_1417/g.2481 Transcript_1417/m.2481 type:complete len:127 (-) Transcript_1417:856-1236(-)
MCVSYLSSKANLPTAWEVTAISLSLSLSRFGATRDQVASRVAESLAEVVFVVAVAVGLDLVGLVDMRRRRRRYLNLEPLLNANDCEDGRVAGAAVCIHCPGGPRLQRNSKGWLEFPRRCLQCRFPV